MKKWVALISMAILVLTGGCSPGIDESIPSSVSDSSLSNPSQIPQDKTYGFTVDRFGATGKRYEPEEIMRGTQPYPDEMMHFTQEEKESQREAAEQLLVRLQQLVIDGGKRLDIEPGYYRFGKVTAKSFTLYQMEDVKIVGGPGVHFIQEKEENILSIDGCRNVTIKGITVDYDPLPFVQGTVLRVDNGSPVVSIDNAYQENFERLRGRILNNRVLYFDGKNPEWEKSVSSTTGFLQRLDEVADGEYRIVYKENPDPITFHVPNIDLVPGDKVVFVARGGGNPVKLKNCENVTLEDIDIYASYGLAIAENDGVGGNTFRRVRLIRRPGTDRLLSSAADGLHSTSMKNGALIEKCEFSHTEDDLLNIHSFNGFISKVISDTEYEIVFPLTTMLEAGADIAFLEMVTYAYRGAATVTEVTPVENPQAYQSFPQSILAAKGLETRPFNTPSAFVVQLDHAIEAELYDVVSCGGYSSKGLIIRDSYFHDGHVNAILITGPEAQVRNNIIRRTGGNGVGLIRGGYWSEGPYPSGIVIENNLFEETCLAFEGQIRPGVITAYAYPYNLQGILAAEKNLLKDITVSNNEFHNNRVGAFFGFNVSGITFSDNIVRDFYTQPLYQHAINTNNVQGFKRVYYGFYVDCCENITVKDNVFSGLGEYGLGDIFIGDNTSNVER